MVLRLLKAVLLLASLNVAAEVTLTEIESSDVADADVVMDNFNALKQGVDSNATATEALPTPPPD